MTYKQLSPAVEAMLDAFTDEWTWQTMPDPRKSLAAALRAAVDQVVPENANAVGDEHDDARHDQWMRIRYKLLDIANELEAL
jgi:hypothetical protein